MGLAKCFCIILLNLLFLSTFTILVSSHCENTHFHCFESGDYTADCDDSKSWASLSSICNGKFDCPNGEEEAIFLCKRHTKHLRFESYFYCATGAVIDGEFACNNVTNNCSDNSDELNCEYNLLDAQQLRGNCGELQIECLPGECVDLDKKCDGCHDCTNGLDESLKICIRNCTNVEFQCGNGQCIQRELLCNDKYDCPDGADELPIVCNDAITPKEIRSPNICLKPDSLEFANFVKTHQNRTNGSRYVLPNTPVMFECPLTEELVGFQWNVCEPNGTWAYELPKCTDPLKTGCPLPIPKKGRPKLYKCKNSKISSCNTTIELMPPIEDMFVHLKCNEGYKIEPEELNTKAVSCVNNKWNLFITPRCRKI